MRRTSKLAVLVAITAAISLFFSGLAIADTVSNDIATTAEGRIRQAEAGTALAIDYWVNEQSAKQETGANGQGANTSTCNAPLTVAQSAPANVTVSPSSHQFTGCGTANKKQFTFQSATLGDHTIPDATVPNAGSGVTTSAGTGFKLRVVPRPAGTPSASNITASSVKLTWSRSQDHGAITSYVVSRGTTATGPWTQLAVEPKDSNAQNQSYTDSTASASTTYYYNVVARYTAGGINFDSARSGNVSATTSSAIAATTTTAQNANATFGASSVNLNASVLPSTATGTVEFIVKNAADTQVGEAVAGTLSSGTATASFPLSSLGAGTYTIAAAYSGAPGFAPSSDNTKSLTFAKRDSTLSVSANPNAALVGQAVTLTATVAEAGATGTVQFKVDGQNVGAPQTLSSGTATLQQTYNTAGSRAVSAVYSGDGNHNGKTGALVGDLVVNKVPTGLSAQGVTATYGSPATLTATLVAGEQPLAGKTISFTFRGSDAGTAVTNADGVATVDNVAVGNATSNAIANGLGVSFAGDDTYNQSANSAAVTVNKAALNVTADDNHREYGAANPAMGVTYSGFVNNDTASSLGGVLVCEGPAATAAVGPHAISCSGLTSSNYDLSFVNGSMTITPAALSVTASGATRTYGAANPAFTGTIIGILNNDDISASYGTTADAASGVGNHAIVPTLSGARLSNYTVTSNNGVLAVTPAPLTITAGSKTRTYGDDNGDLNTGLSFSGFVNGEDRSVLGGPEACQTEATAATNVGTAAITCSGLSSANYSVTWLPGTLTINQADLTVTADNKSRPYGVSNPTLTADKAGVKNGDAIDVALSTAATQSSDIGDYSIHVGDVTGAKIGNYNVTKRDGTLSVDKAPLTVTADNKSREYGAANPALTADKAGVKNGDAIDVALSTAATRSSDAGNYDIVVGDVTGDKISNYNVTKNNGALTITQANLTVTANNKTRDFGAANPAFDAAITGWKNDDSASSLTAGPSCSSAADASSVAGTYPITCSGAEAGNYSFTYAAGTLTVNAWTVGAFRAPIDSRPTLNRLKAGSAVPMKFSLGGNRGLDIFQAGYPKPLAVDCKSGVITDDIESVVAAASNSLTYDSVSNTYNYVWKTASTMANSCRQLQMKFKDGSIQSADFTFTK